MNDDRITELLNEYFSCDVGFEDNKHAISYKSLKRMEVWVEEKKLCVDTESNMDADHADVSDTNKRFRAFLVAATGYTAKERVKRMKKESN